MLKAVLSIFICILIGKAIFVFLDSVEYAAIILIFIWQFLALSNTARYHYNMNKILLETLNDSGQYRSDNK